MKQSLGERWVCSFPRVPTPTEKAPTLPFCPVPFCKYRPIPFCPYTILSVSLPFCAAFAIEAPISENLSVYFVPTIFSVPFCPIPFCPRTPLAGPQLSNDPQKKPMLPQSNHVIWLH